MYREGIKREWGGEGEEREIMFWLVRYNGAVWGNKWPLLFEVAYECLKCIEKIRIVFVK